MLAVERDFPGVCYPLLGLHTCDVGEGLFEAQLAQDRRLVGQTYFLVQFGETGIDLYWDTTYFEQQQESAAKTHHLGQRTSALPA